MKQILSVKVTIVFILLLSMISLSTKANDTVHIAIEQVQNEELAQIKTLHETERLLDKYGTKLAVAFSESLDKVTPMAGQAWSYAIKYQKAKGYSFIVIPWIIVLFCLILLLLGRIWYFKMDSESNKELLSTVSVVLFIVLGFAGVLGLFILPKGIMLLLAPEWFAFQDIMLLLP